LCWSQTIVFAPTIERAVEWAAEMGAVVVHSEMKVEERRAALDAFRSGRTTTLVNVGILAEGYDDPSVDAIILARGCTAGLYLQIVGRALRPYPGKSEPSLSTFAASRMTTGTLNRHVSTRLMAGRLARKTHINSARAAEHHSATAIRATHADTSPLLASVCRSKLLVTRW
jgi:superfamily II DNA or RNA helicase